MKRYSVSEVKELLKIYDSIRDVIVKRVNSFKKLFKYGSEEELFAELAFCILTPQSKAKLCWRAIKSLLKEKKLFHGNREEILAELKGVRFKYKKSLYIVRARSLFTDGNTIKVREKLLEFENPFDVREWLVKNIYGFGYKEASHFLRNIGASEEQAILDRHILKNLKKLNVIHQIPNSISKKQYLCIEEDMKAFAECIKIPLSHLDLLLWYRETGEIFK